MASLLDKKVVKDDKKFLIGIVLIFLFLAWLCSPIGNRYTNLSYCVNTIGYSIAKITNSTRTPEYVHLRNKAVYMAHLHSKQPKMSLREIDNAIAAVPEYVPDTELSKLYKDRAYLKLYFGDKQGALSDFLLSSDYDINDKFILAILLSEKKQYKMATDYCKSILESDYQAFIGYACLSHVYEAAGRADVALRLYNLAVEKKPGSAKAYMERAQLKMRMGDMKGYTEDSDKAKQLSPNIENQRSVVEEAISPKRCTLTVI